MQGGRSLLRIKLETGRSHQIRVQMAQLGHPLVGTGATGPSRERQIALWAEELSFRHPTTDALLEFRSRPRVRPWAAFQDVLAFN